MAKKMLTIISPFSNCNLFAGTGAYLRFVKKKKKQYLRSTIEGLSIKQGKPI